MSFGDLQNSRKSKQSKSYVSNIGKPKDAESSSPQVPVTKLDIGDLYKTLPASLLEIRTSPTSGRGIHALQAVSAGSVLMAVKPSIAVLSNYYLETYCSGCASPAPDSGLKRCPRCRVIWYCGSTCQDKDWASHKLECHALVKWAETAPSPELAVPSDAVRGLARMLWKKQKAPSGVLAREFEAMESHRASLQPSAFELHTHLAHSLVRFLRISSPEEMQKFGFTSAGDLVDVISRFITNTFTLTTPSLTPLGVSVSPVIALFNHSCEPNAVIVFPRATNGAPTLEPLMQVVAIRDIHPNEEILTAYLDTTLPKASRQATLQETYSFKCACALCTRSIGVDPRESMRCSKSCGGTCPLPTEEDSFTRCAKCKTVVSNTDAVLDALRVGQQGLEKATSLQFKDPNKAVQLTTNLIPILSSAGLTFSCHPLLALTRLHQSLLISAMGEKLDQDTLDETIRIATKAVSGLTGILTPGHPVRGLALAELGKIMAVDEPAPRNPTTVAEKAAYPPSGHPRLKMALDNLVNAREELLVGFGKVNEGGEVGKAVREEIIVIERELGAFKQGVKNVMASTSAV